MWHTYFQVDGQRIAEDYGVTGALKHHYFHNDDQATIGLVTDDTFNVANVSGGTGIWNVQNEGSAAFGQPRGANGSVDYYWGAGDVTRRRWINQEDLADVQLIDLNARVYDPLLGKFMSPDPIISDQDDSQSWNAYAYSHNNPMSGEDPTGLACTTTDNSGCGSSGSPSPPENILAQGHKNNADGPMSAHGASAVSHPYVQSPSGHRYGPGTTYYSVTQRANNGSRGAAAALAASGAVGSTTDSGGNTTVYGTASDLAKSVMGDARSYDPSNPNYHHYDITDAMCGSSMAGCTKQNVFQNGLMFNNAPGQTGAATTGGEMTVPFAGKIFQIVDPSTFSIYNITEAGHIFDPGYVKRQVVDIPGGIGIRTIGEGTGPYRLFNELIGPPAFENLDANISVQLFLPPRVGQ